MTSMFGRAREIHFVGVGGIGMSGIAELLVNLGYRVSGSDAKASEITERLASLGARIAVGHAAENIGSADVVVVSSAVKADNPEVAAARARHTPVIPRAEMLAELMRLRFGIAIAGAHGKTTTTSMVAWILERAGLDPTAVIGGRLSAFGSNARLGAGPLMVVEADESDRSFLKLSPSIAVITNIDREHMEAYGTFDRVLDAFVDFASKVPFYGAVVACIDDPNVREILPRLSRRVITYGFSDGADVRGLEASTDGRMGHCSVTYRIPGHPDGAGTGEISVSVPGIHNLQNALAAIAVGVELGVPFDKMAGALAEFRGADRRYQIKGTVGGVTVVDDYGHHPTEIAAVLSAARAGSPRRIVAVFQPHRYSRTRDLLPEFGRVLSAADVTVLTDIYPAGESPIPGILSAAIADEIRKQNRGLVEAVIPIESLPAHVASLAKDGDVVLTLGAGSIGAVGDRIVSELRKRTSNQSTSNPGTTNVETANGVRR
jgi:UDP-N-acetylmuramate--alanine ligase